MAGACFSIPVHGKCSAEFHTDSESLIKRHKTVRDTTAASAYHRLKSDDDVIRAIEDLERRIPMAITYHWVEGHQDKTKTVG
jgi:ribonuclease HI